MEKSIIKLQKGVWLLEADTLHKTWREQDCFYVEKNALCIVLCKKTLNLKTHEILNPADVGLARGHAMAFSILYRPDYYVGSKKIEDYSFSWPGVFAKLIDMMYHDDVINGYEILYTPCMKKLWISDIDYMSLIEEEK